MYSRESYDWKNIERQSMPNVSTMQIHDGPPPADGAFDIQDKKVFKQQSCYCCTIPGLVDYEYADMHLKCLGISSHYRNRYSIRDCLISLFMFHNESINIWSHLLGSITVIIIIHQTMNHDLFRDSTPLETACNIIYFIAALICLVFSTVYHIFGCHSEVAYIALFRLDLCGIGLLIPASYFPLLYYGFYCSHTTQIAYLVLACIVFVTSIIISFLANTEIHKFDHNDAIRDYGFAALVVVGLIPCLHWLIISPAEFHKFVDIGFVSMLIFYIIGFYVFMYRFPESSYPGKFDLLLSSHQIWHICIVMAVVSWSYWIWANRTLYNKYECSLH